MQVREEISQWTSGLDHDALWATPAGLAPAGFQLRHIAGSLDRLSSYLRGEQLTEAQLAALRDEMNPSATLADLLTAVHKALENAESLVRASDPASYAEFRGVGRRQLPTTVGGLILHLAEHTQRHLGQLIVTIKVLRATST
jgi:uncharacterized damage-inducible protein DinB